MPSLRRSLAATIAAATALRASADSMTTVAVLEMGKGGVTRRTSSPSDNEATVAGVSSLWNSLHDTGRRATSASSGMSVVSDLFAKPDGGLAIGITGGVDLASMPAVSSLLEGGSVSTVRLAGSRGEALLDEAGATDVAKDVGRALSQKAEAVLSSEGNSLEAVRIGVDQDSAASADAHLSRVLKGLHKEATDAGKTVVVHLVVEEEEGAARRRQLERNLDEEEGDEEGEGEEDKEEEGEGDQGDADEDAQGDADEDAQGDADEDAQGDGDEDAQEEDANQKQANYNNNNGQYQSGYYGYGYYDDNNEWVQVSKTIFQIQYNNVCLWTAIGLVVVLWWSTALMVNMPLMADTLLFGESAKMMGD